MFLNTKPWGHQQAAYQFAMEQLLEGDGGAMMAMGMGTGKTLVTLMTMVGVEAKRVLITCPLRAVNVWKEQIEKHLNLPVNVLALDENEGSVSRRVKKAEEGWGAANGEVFIVIVNYQAAWRPAFKQWAYSKRWDMVVADESHKLKAHEGVASRCLADLGIGARYRLALTGTPMPHSPLDIFAQMRFVDESVFGSNYYRFRDKYAILGGYQDKQVVGYRNIEDLQDRMKKTTFRVGKEVLDLPAETHVIYRCQLGLEARKAYQELEYRFKAGVKDKTITASNALVKLLRLQQVAGGWLKADDGTEERIDSAKLFLLADILEDIGDEPVVVFGRFHSDLDAIKMAARSVDKNSLELSGRRNELAEWKNDGAQVLAVQPQSGSEAIELTKARYCIFYSLSFSLGEYDQAMSRVHRPGQTRPVEYIHLMADNTVDGVILKALNDRKDVVGAILEEVR